MNLHSQNPDKRFGAGTKIAIPGPEPTKAAMEQMHIDPENLVSIDFENGPYSKTIRTFRPDVYRQDGVYHALLGPDTTSGILGSGPTPDVALSDWDKQLAAFISRQHSPDDQVAEFVFDTLGTSRKDVW